MEKVKGFVMRIKNIATVTIGLLTSRKKAKTTNGLEYLVLTLKSFHRNGYLLKEECEVFYAKEVVNESFLAKEHDVIVRASWPYTAIIVTRENQGILIPSQFLIIRMDRQKNSLLADYLAFYLNSTYAQNYFDAQSFGSAVKAITKIKLQEFDVKIIDMEQQSNLIKYMNEGRREQILLEKQLLLREQELQEVLSTTLGLEER